MRILWVLPCVCAASIVTQGCKGDKPPPIPGPKATAQAVRRYHASGITWFQGTFEEAFSRVNPHRPMRLDSAAGRARPETCGAGPRL